MSPKTIETKDTDLDTSAAQNDAATVSPSIRASGPEAEASSGLRARIAGAVDRVVERVKSSSTRDRILMGVGFVGAIGVAVVVSTMLGGETSPAPAVDPRPIGNPATRQLSKPQPRLTTKEYVDLGKGALKESRIAEARRHFESALSTRPVDRRVRAEICQLMADVCHRSGQHDASALYREEAATLLSGLSDTALAVFAIAESELAHGRVRAARRRFHAIALGGGQAGPVDPALRSEAERRLARTYEAEFMAMYGSTIDRIADPAVFVEKGSR